jgi:hypothetical protein
MWGERVDESDLESTIFPRCYTPALFSHAALIQPSIQPSI